MKRLSLATAAFFSAATMASAADVAVKAPPAAPAPFNWTGCYFGAEGGGNWGRSSQVAASSANVGLPITGDFNLSGGVAGGTVGCNYDISNFVLGIEGDYSWTDTKGSAIDRPPFGITVATTSATREKWLQTLRGRFGYAFDRFMVYGTGGLATAGTAVDVTNTLATVTDTQPRTGWTAGVGGEWAAWTAPWGAVTVKAEYLHADFGTKSYVNPPVLTSAGTTVITRNVMLTNDMVRVGMNLLFNWGSAAPAK
jgi:outer membrane immunogenic protein